jgi:hypothetical protein
MVQVAAIAPAKAPNAKCSGVLQFENEAIVQLESVDSQSHTEDPHNMD